MADDLKSVLKNWGLEHIDPVEVPVGGAAIAAGVWNLNERYCLKTGSNFEGLKKHAGISKILRDNGITASCPLPTLDGSDFITVGDHYYVITERVADNFLSTSVTDPAQDDARFAMYAAEIRAFRRALESGSEDLLRMLGEAAGETGATAERLGAYFTGDIRKWQDGAVDDGGILEGFVCGTRFRMTPEELISRLGAEGSEAAAFAMITLFIAWTDGRPIYDGLNTGNFAAAAAMARALRKREGRA